MKTRTTDFLISDLFAMSVGDSHVTHSKGWVAFMVPTNTRFVKPFGLLVSKAKEVLVFINQDIEAAISDETLKKGRKVTVTYVGELATDKEHILLVELESGRAIFNSHDIPD